MKLKHLFLVLSILFLSACANRDVSNVKVSLYGHWEVVEEDSSDTEDNKSDYFFRSLEYTYLNKDEEKKEYTYKILDYDEIKNIIQIEVTDEEKESSHIQEIEFQDDERTVAKITTYLETFVILPSSNETQLEFFVRETVNEQTKKMNAGKITSIKIQYVDSKEEP